MVHPSQKSHVTTNYRKGREGHIIRRLGKAVIAQWVHLDELTRDRLFKQAMLIQDDHQTVQLEQQMRAFIDKYKVIE
jgi:hypothetical protein